MDNFFKTTEGKELEPSTEAVAGGLPPLIPVGTKLLCAIASVEVEPEDDYGNNEHVVIMLHVTERGEYKDFTVNHKLHVNDDKAKKADKARETLLAYDANCKGELLKKARAGQNIMDAATLSLALNGGEVMTEFDVWEMERQERDKNNKPVFDDDGEPVMVKFSGNWVRGIYPITKDNNIEEQAKTQQPTQTNISEKQAIDRVNRDEFDTNTPDPDNF